MTLIEINAPERSREQRLAALRLANSVRTYRSQLKRDITAGLVDPATVLHKPPEVVLTMKVWDLLLAIPKVGRTKANKMLQRSRTSPSKTVGGLSIRQRDEILQMIEAPPVVRRAA